MSPWPWQIPPCPEPEPGEVPGLRPAGEIDAAMPGPGPGGGDLAADLSAAVARLAAPVTEAERRAQREKLAAGARATRARSRRLDACAWGYCAWCDREVPLRRGRIVPHKTHRPPPDMYNAGRWGHARWECAGTGERPSEPPQQLMCWAAAALLRRRAAGGA